MKTYKQIIAEVNEPKSGDEKRFKDKHVVQKNEDPAGNKDDVFKGSKVEKDKTKKASYKPGEDEEVHEEKEEEESDTTEGRRPKSKDGEEEEGGEHIAMQLRKAITMRGQKKVKFNDGKEVKISVRDADKFFNKFNKTRMAADKLKMTRDAAKSYDSFKKIIDEELSEATFRVEVDGEGVETVSARTPNEAEAKALRKMGVRGTKGKTYKSKVSVKKIKEEINEGTWYVPNSDKDIKQLIKVLGKALPVGDETKDPGTEEEFAKHMKTLGKSKVPIGDDSFYDNAYLLSKKKGPRADLRPEIINSLVDLGMLDRRGTPSQAISALTMAMKQRKAKGGVGNPRRSSESVNEAVVSKSRRALDKKMFKKIVLNMSERALTDTEMKRREEIAKDLPDKEFKKRYGDDWKSVKMATATNMAKKEEVKEAVDVAKTLQKASKSSKGISVKFDDGSSENIDKNTAKQLLDIHKKLNSSNKKKLEQNLFKSSQDFMKMVDFAMKRA